MAWDNVVNGQSWRLTKYGLLSSQLADVIPNNQNNYNFFILGFSFCDIVFICAFLSVENCSFICLFSTLRFRRSSLIPCFRAFFSSWVSDRDRVTVTRANADINAEQNSCVIFTWSDLAAFIVIVLRSG